MKKAIFISTAIFGSFGLYFSVVFLSPVNVKDDSLSSIVPFVSASENTCKMEFDNLLQSVKRDFSNCSVNPLQETTAKTQEKPKKKNNMVLIFDSSGSMAPKIGGISKLDQAKSAARKFLQDMDAKDLNLSIVAYGHKGSNSTRDKAISCSGIEEVYYMGSINAKVAQAKLDIFKPTGWTPIADSLKKAETILNKYPKEQNNNSILLLSDGEETCGGDPIETARRLKESGLNVHVNVIGFDVVGMEEKQLQAIANAGGGEYFSAKKQEDIEKAFQKHEDLIAKFDNDISMTKQTLGDITKIGNTFASCLLNLEEEKANLILDMYAQKKISTKCQNFVEREYQKRYENTYEQLKKPFHEAMRKVQQNEVMR